MLNDFRIVHRLKPARFAEVFEAPVWATCLRSLAFPANACDVTDADELYTNSDAYEFLLEVVCGLKSPILGETEVFGQFKQFSAEWVKREPKRKSLVQKILTDAKAIRTQHLLELGIQSYGSWIRRNLRSKRAHFLGAGQMAREIMPYLQKKGCSLAVHTRDPLKYIDLSAVAINDCKFDRGALIIAAPMSASEIEKWLIGRKPDEIIDLRDNSREDRLEMNVQTVRLHDIFSEIEVTKRKLMPRLEAAQKAILECSRRASAQAIVRPQGWDDLCA